MPKKKRLLTFSKAINEAIDISMSKNPSVLLMALGVDDPKGIFGTTIGLYEKYGKSRNSKQICAAVGFYDPESQYTCPTRLPPREPWDNEWLKCTGMHLEC